MAETNSYVVKIHKQELSSAQQEGDKTDEALTYTKLGNVHSTSVANKGHKDA